MSVGVGAGGVGFVLERPFRSGRSPAVGGRKTPSMVVGSSGGDGNFDRSFPEFYSSVLAEIFRVGSFFHYLSNAVGLESFGGREVGDLK